MLIYVLLYVNFFPVACIFMKYVLVDCMYDILVDCMYEVLAACIYMISFAIGIFHPFILPPVLIFYLMLFYMEMTLIIGWYRSELTSH